MFSFFSKNKYKIGSIIFGLLLFHFLWFFDQIIAPIYDFTQNQRIISLNDLPSLSFQELPKEEQKKYLNPSCGSVNYKKKKYLKIAWFDRYKKINKYCRINKLLTPDRLIGNHIRIPNLQKTQYLLLDNKVINVYTKKLSICKKKGLNINNIHIASGFRHPMYNKMVNGARCSQHQVGTAIDISIGDINNDGKRNQKDRKLIYDILNKKLIINKGGLGKYKNSPFLIHFDTRGHKARW